MRAAVASLAPSAHNTAFNTYTFCTTCAGSNLKVLEALVGGRAVQPSVRQATASSAWLTFSTLGLPWPQLPASEPARLSLLVEGLHEYACPAATMFPTPAPRCQYVVRGSAGQQQCCSRGLSRQWQGDSCGCRCGALAGPAGQMLLSVGGACMGADYYRGAGHDH